MAGKASQRWFWTELCGIIWSSSPSADFCKQTNKQQEYIFTTSWSTKNSYYTNFQVVGQKVNSGKWKMVMLERPAGAGLESFVSMTKEIGFDPGLVAIYWNSCKIIRWKWMCYASVLESSLDCCMSYGTEGHESGDHTRIEMSHFSFLSQLILAFHFFF